MLRAQLPHYNVDVTVNTRWDHIFLWVMAVIICFVYLGVRLYYLLKGKTAEFGGQNTSVAYSYVVLVGELFLSGLGFYGQQCFWKQDVRFSSMDAETLRHIFQDTTRNGVRQTVHVLITTYTEPAHTVKECVVRCLVCPEPIYMEKHIYVCDDGHTKSEGPKKRAMVEELRVLGMHSFCAILLVFLKTDLENISCKNESNLCWLRITIILRDHVHSCTSGNVSTRTTCSYMPTCRGRIHVCMQHSIRSI